MDSGSGPVTLPPGPPLPGHAGLGPLDRTYRGVPHADAEDRGSFRLACEIRPPKGTLTQREPERSLSTHLAGFCLPQFLNYLGGIQWDSSSVAKVYCRQWKRIRGKPARSRSGLKLKDR